MLLMKILPSMRIALLEQATRPTSQFCVRQIYRGEPNNRGRLWPDPVRRGVDDSKLDRLLVREAYMPRSATRPPGCGARDDHVSGLSSWHWIASQTFT